MPPSRRIEGADLVSVLSAPRSVVVVGASPDPASYASKPIAFLQREGFAGRILAVNPNHAEVAGVPCLKSIGQIEPGTIELAMVTLPAPAVKDALLALDAVGVKAAISIASGFDADGGRMRADLRAAIRDTSMRVIGPNCIGVVNTRSRTYLTFSREIGRGTPRTGSIALVTQSGAMGNATLISMLRRGAGISHWITSGDEIDVGSLELIAGLLHDDAVRGVGVFFEGMADVGWLPAVSDAIAATGKPVYALKGATTDAGRTAAAGHTGRVVGSSEAAMAVMRDAGITIVGGTAELADALVALDVLRALPGPRIGIVSISGGCGVIGADAVRRSTRLRMADVGSDEALRALVGGRVHAVANPVDVAGSPTRVFADWIQGFAASPACDAVIAVQSAMLNPDSLLADALIARATGAPIVVVPFTDAEAIQGEIAERLATRGIAVMPTVERAVAALDALPMGAACPSDEAQMPSSADSALLGLEAAAVVLPDLPWAPFAAVDDEHAARERAVDFGYPVVVKVAGRALHHRSEAGGVALGVTADGLASAHARIAAVAHRAGDAVLVQSQAPRGVEVMVSAMRDPELGAVATVRPGGVLTELIPGNAILWSGWDAARRRERLAASIAGTLLLGYRGSPVHDFAALAGLVERLLDAVAARTIDFIELNPVIVGSRGVWLVDALIRPSQANRT